MRKKCFFRLFRIDAKRRNLKRNENGTKRKQNEKEAKNCHNFCSEVKWSEMKRNGSEKLSSFSLLSEKRNGSKKLPSFSLQSKMEAKFFFFDAKKWNEAKTKRKRSDNFKAKRIKWNSGTISKESKKNIKAGLLLFHLYLVWWKEVKKRLFRFALKRNKAKKRLFCFALKRNGKIGSETKNFWKRNKAKIHSNNFA